MNKKGKGLERSIVFSAIMILLTWIRDNNVLGK